MANEMPALLQPEESDEIEAESSEKPKRLARLCEPLRRLGSLIVRPWRYTARALAWLRRPDE
ncbi:MAG: hypothetical protein IMY86_04715, partial [Chloroflexi bacterium]|nr:hypothetical protein [Chloroflexota bacterium]